MSLTALVDTTFLLMIFFMVSTSFSTAQQMSLDISARLSVGRVSSENLLVRLEEGQIILGGSVQSAENVRKAVREALAKAPEATVTLAVGKGVAVQFLVEVMDLVNASGATKVVLARG